MAKKKGGSSNLGLIITLVFFVLTTVILGVTTYMGFADQETKEAAKKKAEGEKAVAENDAKYYRGIYRILRTYQGDPPAGVDAAEVAREKKALDDGSWPPAKDQKDKGENVGYFKKLNDVYPWDASKDTAPSMNVVDRIKALQTEVDNYKAKAKKAEDLVKRTEAEKKELDDSKTDLIAKHQKALDNLRDKANADLKALQEQIAAQRLTVGKEGDGRAKLAVEKDAAEGKVKKLTDEVAKLKGDLLASKTTERAAVAERDEMKDQLEAARVKSGLSAEALAEKVLDAKGREVLKAWKKNWRIVQIATRGEAAYINLGSVDGIEPQVTFSIHALTANGTLSATPKGTVEVVQVTGPNMAKVKITSVKDPQKDPILANDRLFNPTWDPVRRRHVAVAGVADLGGDGSDSVDEFRRLLRRQNVELDAYIDGKGPKIVGRGISTNTDYLIVSEDPERVRASGEKEYAAQYKALRSELEKKAKENGVAVISLKRYLDMIGYQPPRVVTSGAGSPR